MSPTSCAMRSSVVDHRSLYDVWGHFVDPWVPGVEISVGFRLTLSRDGPRVRHYRVDGCQRDFGFFGDNLDPFSGIVELGFVGFRSPDKVQVYGLVR